jgi:hypothetical protein
MVAILALGAACTDEPERSVANYCTQVRSLVTLDADLASGNPVQIEARANDLRLLRQVAPAEIEPSIGILLGVTDDFARTAGTATDRAAVADEVFRGRSDDIASIEAAGNAVTTYTTSNCQFDLVGGSSVPGSTSSSVPPGSTGATGPSTASTAPTPPTSAGGAPGSTTTSRPSLLVD